MKSNWPLKYFTPEELLSPDGLAQFSRGNLMLQLEAMIKLDNFRGYLGIPLICNTGNLRLRGYRSCAENSRIPNSAIFSRHVQGIAFDISTHHITYTELYDAAVKFGWSFVKKYPTWVHVDNRSRVLMEKV
jgi:hypothetical protein